MKYYSVIFKGTPNKRYIYKSNLNLPIGAIGKIIADNTTNYQNSVKIVDDRLSSEVLAAITEKMNIREITAFKMESAPARPKDRIEKVIFNEEKGTTVVIWNDGEKTILHLQEGDNWDKEKALALCYMKRILGNRGAFNEVLKKYCN